MNLPDEINQLHAEMCTWRRHIHQFPETAYEETATSQYICEKLREFGLDVHKGMAGTGVVATLQSGAGSASIALRADIDALHIHESNTFSYKSRHDGKMHACGHDGHSAMLLGAAKHLTATCNFNGTVHFIFQPAEEGGAGANQMIEEGLFDIFPVQSVYGMHNYPGMPQGHFAVKSGPMMASYDGFEILINGLATHAAMPHLGNDAIVVAGQVINALQTIVSRNINPADSAVVSLTQIHAGNTWNAIPETARLIGTFRCFTAELQTFIKQQITRIVNAVCQGAGVSVEINFNPETPGYPVTVNSEKETAVAASVAARVAGEEHVNLNPEPSMGAEDFAFMLQEKPGCYILIGNGSADGGCLLHNPNYDFNDEILAIGAAYWVKLVETVLAG